MQQRSKKNKTGARMHRIQREKGNKGDAESGVRKTRALRRVLRVGLRGSTRQGCRRTGSGAVSEGKEVAGTSRERRGSQRTATTIRV